MSGGDLLHADSESTHQSAGWRAPHRLFLALSVLLTFLAYLGTLGFEFVHDDNGQIVLNPYVQSWRFVPRYFTEHVWAFMYPEGVGNYYRPFFLLWLRLNHMLFGLEPRGWHLTTVLVHIAVTLLVYRLALRLAGDRLAAAFAALVFGLHPVHIEAVAWVAGVTEPLLALLFIPAFLCYLNQREQAGRTWLAGSLGLYVLALLTKETALVFPALVFAYEWTVGARGPSFSRVARVRAALVPSVPYLVLSGLYLIPRTLALKAVGHTFVAVPLSTVVRTWPSLLWFYLKHLLWPHPLSTFYDLPYVGQASLTNFALPAAAVGTAALGLWWWSKRSPTLAFASLWLLLPILPVLNLRALLPDDFAQDRYLYLPSVGFSLLVGLGLRRLASGRFKFQGQPASQIGLALGLAALLGLGTASESLYFANDLRFYQHCYSVAPNSIYTQVHMANLLGERGAYSDAIRLYRQVLDHNANFWPANYNLGYTYYRLGRLDEAERYLNRAIEIESYRPDPFLYLGLTKLKRGRLEEAAPALRRAIEIRPWGLGYHFALGIVLKMQGHLQAALDEFNRELLHHPAESAAREQIAEIEAQLRGTHPGKSSAPGLPVPRKQP